MPEKEIPKAVIIAGPTGSGKTSLAVRLASVLDGEVINADSMQVYRYMDIGTAKPTAAEQQGIPHHMLDIVDPDEEFNAAMFRSLALPLIEDICSKGKVCFVVGGTGLYIKTLLGGLLKCPPADPELRESMRKIFDNDGPEKLHEMLMGIDPVAAEKIHPNDRVRIIRALEVHFATGSTFSDLSRKHGFGGKEINALKFCLEIERKELYARIDFRTVNMVRGGLVKETEKLLEKGYTEDLKPLKAIGYRHMVAYLKGEWSLEKAIKKIQRDTRRYAKRQLTWFRSDREFIWTNPDDFDRMVEKITKFIGRVP